MQAGRLRYEKGPPHPASLTASRPLPRWGEAKTLDSRLRGNDTRGRRKGAWTAACAGSNTEAAQGSLDSCVRRNDTLGPLGRPG